LIVVVLGVVAIYMYQFTNTLHLEVEGMEQTEEGEKKRDQKERREERGLIYETR